MKPKTPNETYRYGGANWQKNTNEPAPVDWAERVVRDVFTDVRKNETNYVIVSRQEAPYVDEGVWLVEWWADSLYGFSKYRAYRLHQVFRSSHVVGAIGGAR